MTSTTTPISAHATIEVMAAPLLIAAPFLFGFGVGASAITFALGALLMGLAITTEAHSIPLSAHASFDYVFALVTIIVGISIGLATSEAAPTIFLAGFGAAHLVLTASMRYSSRGA